MKDPEKRKEEGREKVKVKKFMLNKAQIWNIDHDPQPRHNGTLDVMRSIPGCHGTRPLWKEVLASPLPSSHASPVGKVLPHSCSCGGTCFSCHASVPKQLLCWPLPHFKQCALMWQVGDLGLHFSGWLNPTPSMLPGLAWIHFEFLAETEKANLKPQNENRTGTSTNQKLSGVWVFKTLPGRVLHGGLRVSFLSKCI